jgi:endo-1,4-beta-mannosidase
LNRKNIMHPQSNYPHRQRNIRFGLNYVPSKNWWYCWNDWQRDQIAADLDAIAALGADHVRVMALWPWFQPNPLTVSAAHLRRLGELLDEAAARGLDVLVAPLTGWLSGYTFLPPWVADGGKVFQAAAQPGIRGYFAALLNELSGRENFLGFDVGNEINCLAPFAMPAADGDAWAARLAAWLRPRLHGRWLVNGVDHAPWLTGRTFSTEHLVTTYDAAAVHAWPLFTSCLTRGALDDAPALRIGAFLTHLVRHQQRRYNVSAPVWIQEFGCSELWGDAAAREQYLRASVANAARAGATWFTWWCSHEIDRAYQFDPLEYDLGLLTTDNRPKPLAAVWREVVAAHADAHYPPEPIYAGFPADFTPAMTQVFPPAQYLEQNLATTTWAVFERYYQSF